MKILLVRLRQIGDVVFTTPGHPRAAPTLPRRASRLRRRARGSADRRRQSASRRGDRRAAARGFCRGPRARPAPARRERFDLAIDFHGGPRASLLTWLSGAPRRIGYDVAGRSWMYTHARVAAARAAAAPLGREPVGSAGAARHRSAGSNRVRRSRCRSTRGGGRASASGSPTPASLPADDLVVIHVSAGNPFRRWPLPHFAALARVAGIRRRPVASSSRPDRPSDDAAAQSSTRRDDASNADERARSCRAASSRSPSCARWSIARRCTSAATAGRCTSRPPAAVPIVGTVRTDAAGALGAVARSVASSGSRGGAGTTVPAVRSARLRAGRFPLPDDHRARTSRGGRRAPPQTRLNSRAAGQLAIHGGRRRRRPDLGRDRVELVGVASLFAMAGALQFSIAAAQILLAVSVVCWVALLAIGRERFAAPRFFWPLLGYAAYTLVSAAFSPDPRPACSTASSWSCS